MGQRMKSKENTSRKRIKVNKTNMEKRGAFEEEAKAYGRLGREG